MKHLISLTLLLSLTACIKTADQVHREQRLENMSEQVKDSQGLMADLVAQIKSMQTQLDRMNGRIEEVEHRQKGVDPENLGKVAETVALLKTQQEGDAQQLVQIQNELKEQRTFLEKVTTSLGSLKEEAPKAKKKTVKSELSEALQMVSGNQYSEARPILEGLIDHEGLSPGDQNKVLHGLGRTEFYTKNYEKALTYFSKVFTKYPKASLAPDCLLFIGRTLKKIGKKDEAQEALNKLVEDYPSSKAAALAKSER